MEINSNMKKLICILFVGLYLFNNPIFAAIPTKPFPPRLVNDLASVFTAEEANALESKLVDLSNSTKTQIAVVTVRSLDGESPYQYATQIGQEWGIGDAKFDNGIVILYKPKTSDSKGEVFIATGYGLEGVVPDAIAKRIVEVEMIPEFKRGNTYKGIDAAVNTLISLSKKEFTASDYDKKHPKKSKSAPIIIFIIIFFVIISSFRRTKSIGNSSIGRSNVPFWVLLGMMGSGNRHSGSFGNFSSGGGSFGGFGGGSFGGGGSGGSW